MKILSITRKPISTDLQVPLTFIIGRAPAAPGHQADPDEAVVEKIAYFKESYRGGKEEYSPAHYVIHFTNSNVRMRIDASEVPEIAYELEDKKKEKAAEAPLPSGDEQEGQQEGGQG